MPDLERNKEAVVAFYDMAFNQSRPREAMERYAGNEYIQHNPGVKDGKEGFIAYFEDMHRRYPGKRATFKRVRKDRRALGRAASCARFLGECERHVLM